MLPGEPLAICSGNCLYEFFFLIFIPLHFKCLCKLILNHNSYMVVNSNYRDLGNIQHLRMCVYVDFKPYLLLLSPKKSFHEL